METKPDLQPWDVRHCESPLRAASGYINRSASNSFKNTNGDTLKAVKLEIETKCGGATTSGLMRKYMNPVSLISLHRKARSNYLATDILDELDASTNLAASAIDTNALVPELRY